MTTARPLRTDRVEERVASEFFSDDFRRELTRCLEALSPQEARAITLRLGLDSSNRKRLSDIGRELGVGLDRARALVGQAEAKLRADQRFRELVLYLDTDHGGPRDCKRLPSDALRPSPLPPLVRCEKHGSYRAPEIDPPKCLVCDCTAWGAETDPRWSTKWYCSNACRQVAYRRRKAAREAGHTAST